jgi:hypothetical protein
MMVLESRMLRKVSELEREELDRDWRKIHIKWRRGFISRQMFLG